jgi:hypothetical protein
MTSYTAFPKTQYIDFFHTAQIPEAGKIFGGGVKEFLRCQSIVSACNT